MIRASCTAATGRWAPICEALAALITRPTKAGSVCTTRASSAMETPSLRVSRITAKAAPLGEGNSPIAFSSWSFSSLNRLLSSANGMAAEEAV
jgi:hypothetical protein